MGVSIEDGIRSVACDSCDREIRGDAVNKYPYVYHQDCVPTNK